MNNEKYIVCVNGAGIGNRLRGLISAMRLSKILNRKLLLFWKNSKHLGCDFNDLFENKFDEITQEEFDRIINGDHNFKLYRDVLDEDYNNHKYLILDTWKWIFLPGEIEEGFNKTYASEKGNNIDFEFDRIPVKQRLDILTELIELRINKDVLTLIKEFEKKYNLKEYTGMHIRRGDNKFTTDGREKISSDEKFEKIIKDNPNEKFFISTDSVEVAKRMKEKFGERIIYFPSEDKKRINKESIQEALAAIVLLSKTKKLYGSFLSTFSEMVWWYSGCKIPVEIVGEEDVNKDFFPKTFLQKVIRKLKFYKVNLQRELAGVYK